jgi:hypothetical protein
MAKLYKRFEIATHVTHSRDPVREKQRKNKIAAAGWFTGAGKMDVHVNEAGD